MNKLKRPINRLINYLKIKLDPLNMDYTYNELVFCTVGAIVCTAILFYMGVI